MVAEVEEVEAEEETIVETETVVEDKEEVKVEKSEEAVAALGEVVKRKWKRI